MRHTGRKYIAMVAILALVGAGCATTGKSTGAGAGIGAAIGVGIAALAEGDAATIAAAGAAGAAVGAGVGYAIHKKKQKKLASAEQAAQEYEYTASEGLKLDIRSAEVTPAVAPPGDSVSATMHYATLGSAASNSGLTERYTLIQPTGPNGSKPDDVLLYEEDVPLEDGIWESGIDFDLPKDLAPGEYTLAQQIEADGKVVTQNSKFIVGTQTASAN